MRIGLIVDGITEVVSFPNLCRTVLRGGEHTLSKVLKASMDGTYLPAQVAKACEPVLRIHAGLGTEFCLIVLDRETNMACPGTVANAIVGQVARVTDLPTAVIIKDRMVENWVIADIEAIARMPARFRVTNAERRAVSPNRADSVDALAILKKMAQRRAYDKVQDGKRILDASEPLTMAANSRSFRKLMSVVGHPAYARQSRNP